MRVVILGLVLIKLGSINQCRLKVRLTGENLKDFITVRIIKPNLYLDLDNIKAQDKLLKNPWNQLLKANYLKPLYKNLYLKIHYQMSKRVKDNNFLQILK